jgi:hypothetical protein
MSTSLSATGVKFRGTFPSFDYTWTLSIASDSSKVESKLKYVDKYDGWEKRCPTMGSEHPDLKRLYLQKMEANRVPGAQVEVSLTYLNFDETVEYPGRKAGPIVRYGMEISVSDEPLLTHPEFQNLDEKEQMALQNMINGTLEKPDGTLWENDITSDTDALDLVKQGITSWRCPRLIWVQSFTVKTSNFNTASATNGMGKIDAPPGGAPSGGSRNYMYIGATATPTEDGNFLNIEKRWELSGPRGWNETLYQ